MVGVYWGLGLLGCGIAAVISYETTKDTLGNLQLRLTGKKTEMRRFFWGWMCFSMVPLLAGIINYLVWESIVGNMLFAITTGVFVGGQLGLVLSRGRYRRWLKRQKREAKKKKAA